MIMALLSFAKKAPELIKKLLPESLQGSGLSFGVSAKDRAGFGMIAKPAKRVAGVGASAVGGGLVNASMGAIDRYNMAKRLGWNNKKSIGAAMSGVGGGMFRGFKQGFKNKGNVFKNIPAGFKAQHEADIKYEDLIASGGTGRGALKSKIVSYLGETKGQTYARQINNVNHVGELRDKGMEAIEKVAGVRAIDKALLGLTKEAGETEEHYLMRRKRLQDTRENLADAAFSSAVDGKDHYSYVAFKNLNLDTEINIFT